MAKKGRPRKGAKARSERILICIEPELKEGIGELAAESRRSISDYCRYVLEQHFWLVQQEEQLAIVNEQPAELVETDPKLELPAELDEEEVDKCSKCFYPHPHHHYNCERSSGADDNAL